MAVSKEVKEMISRQTPEERRKATVLLEGYIRGAGLLDHVLGHVTAAREVLEVLKK